MAKPKLLIEQWLPIEAIGAECMRERGASSALPPLYFLHVWWARRPLTVSRAAILASLLPAYPSDEDPDARPWPDRFRSLFPSIDSYKGWFISIIGIKGDSAAARRLIEFEKLTGNRTHANKYGYQRAFTINPSGQQLETLYDLLEWTWGTRQINFCDPMSGGGSIPFEALRYGLTVHANELNPVASLVLRATLDHPARFGFPLAIEIEKYGRVWVDQVRKRLQPFFPKHPETPDGSLKGGMHIWARTVVCPHSGKPVPLSPNWWLIKGPDPIAVKLIADPGESRCRFEIVRGRTACARIQPDKGTVRSGTAISPWTYESINNSYIKAEAQAGRMGQQLYAVEVYTGKTDFRTATKEDDSAFELSVREYERRKQSWEATGLLPIESLPMDTESWTHGNTPAQYDARTFSDLYLPRQLLFHCYSIEEMKKLRDRIEAELPHDRAVEIITYLCLAADKCLDYNSRLMRWDGTRNKAVNTFARHDFSFKWSHAEFDGSRNLAPWALGQIVEAYRGIAKLAAFPSSSLFKFSGSPPIERLRLSNAPAQELPLADESQVSITVDPPYCDNVNYAELADFFYVWQRRAMGDAYPCKITGELTPKDEEAVANPARFAHSKKKREPAEKDYENKMRSCFLEMHRALKQDGVLTVMFTHKRIEAWDTLGVSLISTGFQIDASWPVHTESESSLHQAKKNSATSTILLVCRKREKNTEAIWWDDLRGEVREVARQKAIQFEKQGIKGVDLYISTFGPVLSMISERWPVLTSNTDPKTGDPIPLQPGEALDLARREVINLRKQGLLLGRSVEFDPVTDWYLMAWDAFRAQEFPADEARKLALALGLDLEASLVRDKRLVTKKGKNVTIALPTTRRKKGMVDPEAESFTHLIDALHTAMMVYEEDGSKACQVFIDHHGLRNDSRIKALVQAAMQAIPTTRGKDGKFLRPEMTTLDALRLLVWEDLPAPPEEEVPKIDTQMVLFDRSINDAGGDEHEYGIDEDENPDEESGEEEGEDDE